MYEIDSYIVEGNSSIGLYANDEANNFVVVRTSFGGLIEWEKEYESLRDAVAEFESHREKEAKRGD